MSTTSSTVGFVPVDEPEQPAPAGAALEPAVPQSVHERLRDWADGHIAELPRFWTERPPSLREHLDYATRGDWHPQLDGPARAWHLAYTRAVVLPGTTVAHLFAWAIARPGRFFPLLAVVTVLATALNAIPVIEWFIPDRATWTYWPPLSWLSEWK